MASNLSPLSWRTCSIDGSVLPRLMMEDFGSDFGGVFGTMEDAFAGRIDITLDASGGGGLGGPDNDGGNPALAVTVGAEAFASSFTSSFTLDSAFGPSVAIASSF
eukprot:4961536-Karenia_brevis.AAC.1